MTMTNAIKKEEYIEINSTKFRKDGHTFEDMSSMDKAVLSHIEFMKDLKRSGEANFPDSAFELVWFLGGHSHGVQGASWHSRASLAEGLGYSERTISRNITLLVKYGIVERNPSLKNWVNGGKRRSVNVIRILPVSRQVVPSIEADETNGDKACDVENVSEPIKSIYKKSLKHETNGGHNDNSIKIPIKDQIEVMTLDEVRAKFHDVIVHKEFVKINNGFYGVHSLIKLSRVLNNALKRFNATIHDPYILEAIDEAFKSTAIADKARRIKTSISNYFYSVLEDTMSVAKRKHTRDNNPLFFDFYTA